MLGAMAGGGWVEAADSYAVAELDAVRREPASESSIDLWFLASWEAFRGRVPTADEVTRVLSQRAAAGGGRRDSLLFMSAAARTALARGDSAAALGLLRRLHPSADNLADLAWKPWEALGGERLLLARLLMDRGEAQAALQVASILDSPATVTFLPYLPASLTLRAAAADKLGDSRLAEGLRRRQVMLGKVVKREEPK
jgi:hypothetical protein